MCLIAAAVFATLSIVFAVVAIGHKDYYKVIDIYEEGVGVRCLTGDEHKTTVIRLPEEKTGMLQEFDLIDEDGNVIIDGVWLGAEPEPTTNEG